MTQTRQLAAIMFTDIVGYTALMGSDEEKAIGFLKKNRELQKPIIEAHNGLWIKELGDGVMASFNTVSDAVNAAIKIQEGCSAAREFQLRIGIHLGEVIFENQDVFGDGVNIASRIQAIAYPGTIYISESVQNNVSNKHGIETRYIKEELLKNVKDPVKIYEVFAALVEKFSSLTTDEHSHKSSEKSIAVLPFVNMSNDPEQEYFSDGMAEEIINSLVHIKDLKVAGRTSSFQFKGKNIDLREIGEKLGVNTVLEGSIRKSGNRLRITAQLINVTDGFHLWSEKYDREIDDIFAIQDEIALAITEKLKVTLLEKDKELITKSTTENTEAYEMYLKGRFYLGRRGKHILTSIDYFQLAIDLDSNFALAWAALADANFISTFYSLQPGKDVMEKGKQAAETAIRLDPTLCEPYASLGFYYITLMHNWEEGKKYYSLAIEKNPDYAFGHYLFGLYYFAWAKGEFEEAEKHGQLGIKLAPQSSIAYGIYSLILLSSGKPDEALYIAKKGLDYDANSFLCQRCITLSYTRLKRYKEANDSAEHLIKISERHPHAICDLMEVYSNTENAEKAKNLMNELKQRSSHEFIDAAFMGFASAYAGNIDDAFTYFETALIEKDPMILSIKHLIFSSALPNDIRYQKLLEKIGYSS